MLLRAATRLDRRQQRFDDRPLLVSGVRRVSLRSILHPATVDHATGKVTPPRRRFSNTAGAEVELDRALGVDAAQQRLGDRASLGLVGVQQRGRGVALDGGGGLEAAAW